jgi:hypothetical protein
MADLNEFENVRQQVRSVLADRDKKEVDRTLEVIDNFLVANPDHPIATVMKGCLIVLKAGTLRNPLRKVDLAEEGLLLMDQAMERAAEAESVAGPGADIEMRLIRALTNAGLPVKFRRNEIVREDLGAILNHPLYAHVAPAEQARTKAWLAVTLERDGDTDGAQALLAEARVLDAGIADAAWAEL